MFSCQADITNVFIERVKQLELDTNQCHRLTPLESSLVNQKVFLKAGFHISRYDHYKDSFTAKTKRLVSRILAPD